MNSTIKESLWTQFGASIDMLQNAISQWPQENWESGKRFFYTSYHTLIFLDYYLTQPPDNFKSLLPFTLSEPGVVVEDALDDVTPERIYTKAELLSYLQTCREKCYTVIQSLTDERLSERWVENMDSGSMNYSLLEILLYNMRHVQHHAAQLNMMLRANKQDPPRWVARAKSG